MRVASLAVFVLLPIASTACDLGEPARPFEERTATLPPRDFASGTRLRARYHTIDGAIDVLTTFHDSELGVDCAYDDSNGASHLGPNGTSYCLPPGMAGHREGRGPYLDASCGARGGFTPASGVAATYALVEPRNACTTAPEIHRAGPPELRLVFLKDDSGVCLPADTLSVQAFTGVVPLAAFVRAEEQLDLRASRIGARVLAGVDGSRRVVGGFDRVRAEPARVGTAIDGSRRWLPARTAFVGGGDLLFADAACGAPVAAKIARTATCPLSASVVLEGNCGSGSYFELGAPISALFTRGAPGTACTAASSGDVLAFRLGAPIPASAYEGVVTTDVGTPTARRRGVGALGDLPVAWNEAIAGFSNGPCEVQPVADGSLRCLPAAVASVSLFADAACTAPAFSRTITGCEVEEPRFVTDTRESPRVYQVTGELGAIYTPESGQCLALVPPFPARFFAAQEVAVTLFPTAVLRAD